MPEKPEIHPTISALWKEIEFYNGALQSATRITELQADYRLGRIPKDEVVDKILHDIMVLFNETFLIPNIRKSEQRASQEFNADLVASNSTVSKANRDFEASDSRRLASRRAGLNFICAIYNPQIGITISDAEVSTADNFRPAVEIVVDKPNFDIVDAMFGIRQLPAHGWFSFETIRTFIMNTANTSIQAFNQMRSTCLSSPTEAEVIFSGLDPWKNKGIDDVPIQKVFQRIVSQDINWHQLNVGRVQINHEHLPGVMGIVYGGPNDDRYPTPTFYNVEL